MFTGIVSGPLGGGEPKAIELYVASPIEDLSVYSIGVAEDGQGSLGPQFTFPAVPQSAGTYIYVTSNQDSFQTYFGVPATYVSAAVSALDGNDAVELFHLGRVVDVFGDPNTDGTGQAWEYTAGWATRKPGQYADGGRFVPTSWTFSGPSALAGTASNIAAGPVAFPVGTYDALLQPPLLLTGVVSGALGDGQPKAIEVYVRSHVADLSLYSIGVAEDGRGSLGPQFTFPAVPQSAGTYIYMTSDQDSFQTYFGVPATYVTAVVEEIDGNDAVGLFRLGRVVDVFGDPNTDGTGQPWEYTAGWATRKPGQYADGGRFVPTSWTFSGPSALAGTASNIAAGPVAFPVGTYDALLQPPLLLTGIVSGTLGDGQPKAIELYITSHIENLSKFSIGVAEDGRGSLGPQFTFPAVPQSAGTYICMTSDQDSFQTYFGVRATYVTAAVNALDGNDAVELLRSGRVVDVFGDPNTDGTGQAWEYTAGWATRKPGQYADGGRFVPTSWTFSGPSALAGTASNIAAGPVAFPVGTYDALLQPPLLLTGIVSGTLGDGQPKAIELYITSHIENLSKFSIGVAEDGRGSLGPQFTFPAVPQSAGTYICMTSDQDSFQTYFGVRATYVTAAVNALDGNDAVELLRSGRVVDVFGDPNTDGTGQPWEYTGGWGFRRTGRYADGGRFVPDSWAFSKRAGGPPPGLCGCWHLGGLAGAVRRGACGGRREQGRA